MIPARTVDSINKHEILLEVVQVLTDLNLVIRKDWLVHGWRVNQRRRRRPLYPQDSKSHVTTRVMGTSGYAAPEYVSTAFSNRSFIREERCYGFAVVMIEMLTALRALDPTRPSGKENLVDWIKSYLYDCRKLKAIMDSRLEGRYPSRAALEIAQLALKCIAPEQKGKPALKEVVETLELLQTANYTTTERRKMPRHTSLATRPTPNPRTD